MKTKIIYGGYWVHIRDLINDCSLPPSLKHHNKILPDFKNEFNLSLETVH